MQNQEWYACTCVESGHQQLMTWQHTTHLPTQWAPGGIGKYASRMPFSLPFFLHVVIEKQWRPRLCQRNMQTVSTIHFHLGGAAGIPVPSEFRQVRFCRVYNPITGPHLLTANDKTMTEWESQISTANFLLLSTWHKIYGPPRKENCIALPLHAPQQRRKKSSQELLPILFR